MKETFELPVIYKNDALLFPAELQSYGYSHRIMVTLSSQTIILEPDEEQHYRAIVPERENMPDTELIKAIVETATALLTS